MDTVEPGMWTEKARCTMLVVDDEPFNIDVLTQELEDLGHRAVSARNGREALSLIDVRPSTFRMSGWAASWSIW